MATTTKRNTKNSKTTKNTNNIKNTKSKIAAKRQKKDEAWIDNELGDIVNQENEIEEEGSGSDQEMINMEDLPTISLSATNKNKLALVQDKPESNEQTKSSVVYLGHLPYGFLEDQLKEFFTQFGEVQRLYISKSKKTGRRRGYGFIEFLHPEVAEIVADTMNDYLLFKRKLVCKVLPLLKATKLPWPPMPVVEKPHAAQRAYAEKYNNRQKQISAGVLVKREQKKRKLLASQNIDYQFNGYEAIVKQLTSGKTKTSEEVDEKRQKAEEALWEKRKQTKAVVEEKVLERQTKKLSSKLQAKETRVQKRQKV